MGVEDILSSSSTLAFTSLSFEFCSASHYGGGIFLSLLTAPSSLSFHHNTFRYNTAVKGNSLFVYTASLAYMNESSYTPFLSCDTSIAEEGDGQVHSDEIHTLSDLLGYTTSHCFTWECSEGELDTSGYSGVVYVDPISTADASSCGGRDFACCTLYGATQTSDFVNFYGTLILLQTTTHSISNTGLSVTSTLTIQSYCESSSESTIVEVSNGECMLTASDGNQTLKSFTITLTNQLSKDISLLSITSTATLILNGMIFNCTSTYATSNKPLITVCGGQLTLSGNNTFHWIKRESGNGGVFEFTTIDSNQTISGVTFTSCSSENGGAISSILSSDHKLSLSSLSFESCTTTSNGGALYIDGGDVFSDSTLFFFDIPFISCNATIGSNLYVSVSDITSFFTYLGWSDVIPSRYALSDEGKFVGGYNSNTETVDLLHILFTPSDGEKTSLYISPSSTASHTSSCGWIDIPCTTLSDAYNHRYSSYTSSSFTLYMMNGLHDVSETNTLSFTHSTSVYPSDSSGIVKKVVSNISEGSSGVFVVNITSITVSFTSISFLLISLNCPLYYQSEGTLELNSISILPSSIPLPSTFSSPTISLTHPLLSFLSGTSDVYNLTLSSFTFTHSPLILLHQAYSAFSISHSTFSSISLTHHPLIFISPSTFYSTSFPILTFTQCCFHKISTADEYPSILAIDRQLYSPTYPLSSPHPISSHSLHNSDLYVLNVSLLDSEFIHCLSTQSCYGGVMCIPLFSSISSLTVVNTTAVECECMNGNHSDSDESTPLELGMGGFIFVDCTSPDMLMLSDTESSLEKMNISFTHSLFRSNKADRGMDVFILCTSASLQLSHSRFNDLLLTSDDSNSLVTFSTLTSSFTHDLLQLDTITASPSDKQTHTVNGIVIAVIIISFILLLILIACVFFLIPLHFIHQYFPPDTSSESSDIELTNEADKRGSNTV